MTDTCWYFFGAISANADMRFCAGLIGQPSVGKSSVINVLRGKKVVRVSHTPGEMLERPDQTSRADLKIGSQS